MNSKKKRSLTNLKTSVLHEILTFTSKIRTINEFNKIKKKKLNNVQRFFNYYQRVLVIKGLKRDDIVRLDCVVKQAFEESLYNFNKSVKVKTKKGLTTLLKLLSIFETPKINKLVIDLNLAEKAMVKHPMKVELLSHEKFLSNLKHLTLANLGLSNENYLKSLSQPFYHRIRTLRLESESLSKTEFKVLLEMFQIKCPLLKSIDLSYCKCNESFEVFKGASLPKLEELILANCQITHLDIEWMLSMILPKLQTLDLSFNNFLGITLVFMRMSNFPELQHLNLKGNCIREEGMLHLSLCLFPNLTKLNLQNTSIGSTGLKNLSSAKFYKLEDLNLYSNLITSSGIEYLIQANFPNLINLDLGLNPIGNEGMNYFSKGNFPMLRNLNLEIAEIGDLGISYLKDVNFPLLESLNLSYNDISTSSIKHLIILNLNRLESLNLSVNPISLEVKSIDKLASQLTNFPNMKQLKINNNILQ